MEVGLFSMKELRASDPHGELSRHSSAMVLQHGGGGGGVNMEQNMLILTKRKSC